MVAMRSNSSVGSVGVGGGIIRREPCKKCGLPVFLAERLNVNNYLYHRTCFRCARCSNQLSLANYYETEQDEYCCETCPDEVVPEIETTKKVLIKSLSDDEKEHSIINDLDNLYALEEQKLVTKARNYFLESQLNQSKDMIDGTEVENEEMDEEEPPELPASKPPDLPDLDTLLDKTEEVISTSLEVMPTSFDNIDVISEIIMCDDSDNVNIDNFKESSDNLQPLANNLDSLTNNTEFVTKDDNVDDDITTIVTSNSVEQSVESTDSEVTKLDEVNPIEEAASDNKLQVGDCDKSNVKDEEVKKLETEDSYPEELNPFGDDDDEDEVPVKRESTNPFGSDDDEDENGSVPVKIAEAESPKKILKAPTINLNPFLSDDDDELLSEDDDDVRIHQAINAASTMRPVPKPRHIKPDYLSTPEPSPRKQYSTDKINSTFGSTTSLESSKSGRSGNTPTGTYRKKKPAPPPPTAREIFSSPDSSIQSPLNKSNNIITPGGTLRMRKNRPAPAPPTSTPIKSAIISEEKPNEAHNEILIAQLSTNNELENEKISKDEKNRNRQSLSSAVSFKTTASSKLRKVSSELMHKFRRV